MIAKKDLVVGAKYAGHCRNALIAEWDGVNFIYTRYKFGHGYQEGIPHPEDDQGFDVFVPTRLIEE